MKCIKNLSECRALSITFCTTFFIVSGLSLRERPEVTEVVKEAVHSA